MYKRIAGIVVATAFAVTVGAAQAAAVAENTTASDAKLPKPIATMQQRGALQVVKRFPAAAGLTGYVVKQQGRYAIVYGSGDYVLAGNLVDPDGNNLTAQYYAQYAPKPDYAKVVKALDGNDGLVILGNNAKAPLLYAFEDPNCIFCYKMNEMLFPLVEQGKVRLKIAMVAFVKANSMARATAILAAKDPAAAMRENQAKYVAAHEEGGYAAPKKPAKKFVAAVLANRNAMSDAGFSGTPALVYRASDGKWYGFGGIPDKGLLDKILAGTPNVAR